MENSEFLPISIFDEFEILSESSAPKAIVYDGEMYELTARTYKFPYLYGDAVRLEIGYYSIGTDEDGDHYYLWYADGETVAECDKQIFEYLDKLGIKY